MTFRGGEGSLRYDELEKCVGTFLPVGRGLHDLSKGRYSSVPGLLLLLLYMVLLFKKAIFIINLTVFIIS